jgi:hypothetical protein
MKLRRVLVTVTAVASALGGCAGGRAGERGTSRAARGERDATVADAAQAMVGRWRGAGPCDGVITFRPDGTYERRDYSPGGYRVAGAWALRRDTSPPTLVLTCEESDDRDGVGRIVAVTLVRVDVEELVYQNGGGNLSRYEREDPPARRP